VRLASGALACVTVASHDTVDDVCDSLEVLEAPKPAALLLVSADMSVMRTLRADELIAELQAKHPGSCAGLDL
jgi:hypothetical protein